MKGWPKAPRGLSPADLQQRDRLLAECLAGQTLTRQERRRIKAMALPELRDLAADMAALATMQDEGRSAAEQEAAILGRMEARRLSAAAPAVKE